MLKNFLSLVKPNNKEKKKKKSVSGPSASTPVATDTSFFSEADASILSNSPPKDVVVHRRSLQPTATPNHSDAEHSFIENIFEYDFKVFI
uniref:Uncharacterized protein n=1 Tax=Caenorhabditis tropicalis TaxID=1561998 RepID=A0A1I7UHB8_9PELO